MTELERVKQTARKQGLSDDLTYYGEIEEGRIYHRNDLNGQCEPDVFYLATDPVQIFVGNGAMMIYPSPIEKKILELYDSDQD